MKKYFVFAISFIVLFFAFQMLSGYFLTLFYTPDITKAWTQVDNLSSSVVMKGGSVFTSLLLAFLTAIVAYFISRKFVKNTSK